MARLSSQTQAANLQLLRQQGLIDKNTAAIMRYNARINEIRASQFKLGTNIAGGVAAAGFASMYTAVQQAAKLQQILATVRSETGADDRKMAGVYNTVMAMANRNGMSPIEAGEIFRSISRLTAGQYSVAQMRAVAPTIADFASTIHFNRPDVTVQEATLTGIGTSHLFRAYTPEALTKLLDKVYRLSGLMGESPSQALRQMSYYEPMFKGLKIDDSSSLATMALLDRAGFRNKVGTNVRAMVLEALGPLQMTSHAQQAKGSLLEQMGLFKNGKFAFYNAEGGVDFLGELGQIAKWTSEQQKKGVKVGTLTKELYSLFGKQGGTIAALMADPQMVGILAGIRKYLADKHVGLQAGIKNRDDNMIFQMERAAGNAQADITELGMPWLKSMTGFFRGTADMLHGAQVWLHSHAEVSKAIGSFVAVLTTVASIRFGVGILAAGTKLGGLALAFTSFGARAGTTATAVNIAAERMGVATLGLRSSIFSAGSAAAVNATRFTKLYGVLDSLSLALLGIPAATAAAAGAIGAFAAFLYGLHADKQYVDSHPGAKMFGSNYGAEATAQGQADLDRENAALSDQQLAAYLARHHGRAPGRRGVRTAPLGLKLGHQRSMGAPQPHYDMPGNSILNGLRHPPKLMKMSERAHHTVPGITINVHLPPGTPAENAKKTAMLVGPHLRSIMERSASNVTHALLPNPLTVGFGTG